MTIPYPDRPTEGFLSFNVDLSPVGSLAFEVGFHACDSMPLSHKMALQSGRPSAQAIELTRVLERIIKDSRAIDTEALCIVSGEKVCQSTTSSSLVDLAPGLECQGRSACAGSQWQHSRCDSVGNNCSIAAFQEVRCDGSW